MAKPTQTTPSEQIIQPTIGRIVIVRAVSEEPARDLPGIVATVNESGTLDVVAFDSRGRGTVFLCDLPHVSKAPHGWSWPTREGSPNPG